MTEACIVEKPEKKDMPMMPPGGGMGDMGGNILNNFKCQISNDK